jgi:hypothetical protein
MTGRSTTKISSFFPFCRFSLKREAIADLDGPMSHAGLHSGHGREPGGAGRPLSSRRLHGNLDWLAYAVVIEEVGLTLPKVVTVWSGFSA